MSKSGEGIAKTEVIDWYIEVEIFQLWKDRQIRALAQNSAFVKSKKEWYGVCLIIEICLCTPCSNATLERFFSHLKFIKTDQRTALSAGSLNAIMRIKLRGTSITEFSEKFLDKVVIHWYNEKERRIHQKERKQYKQRVHPSEKEESSSSSYEEDFSDYEWCYLFNYTF